MWEQGSFSHFSSGLSLYVCFPRKYNLQLDGGDRRGGGGGGWLVGRWWGGGAACPTTYLEDGMGSIDGMGEMRWMSMPGCRVLFALICLESSCIVLQ